MPNGEVCSWLLKATARSYKFVYNLECPKVMLLVT